MRSAVLVLLILLNTSCFSQDTTNLVPNWSFEQKTSCPSTQFFEDFVMYWFNPNQNSPNYFDTCATFSQMDVPKNLSNGYQYPKTGTSYCGIVLYGSSEEREYISIKLNKTLEVNHKYCFELFYSLSNICCNSTPDLQVHFSNDSIYQNSIYSINRIPQIVNTNPIFTDTLNWQKMEGQFLAIDNEEYLTIGNFYNDINTSLILFDTNFNTCTYGGAYYYIDDVRLYDCTQPDTTIYEISIFPNPSNGSFVVNYNLNEKTGGSFKIYNAIGQIVYDERLVQNNGTLNLNLLLAEGVYFWEVRDDEKKLLGSDKMVVVY